MIIDSTHRRWIAVTMVIALLAGGLYAVLNQRSPDGLTGGSVVGLWYGIIGSLLMLFAGMLALLKRVPKWRWIGKRQAWLRAHIWLGLLSVVFILCHSGPGLGGLLEQALWLVFGIVIASGVFGLILQYVLPRLLTERVPVEASYEQIPFICAKLCRQADELVDSLSGSAAEKPDRLSVELLEPDARSRRQLREFHEQEVRPFLMRLKRRGTPLADAVRAEAAFELLRGLPGLAAAKEELTELEDICTERRHLAAQERYHVLLHGWLLVHVPLSAALLVLGGVHAVMSLYY